MASILVVDDEAAVRSVLGRMLGRAGHEVLEASDGAAGIEVLRRRSVDVVILDIFMPRLGGLATIPLVRKTWPVLKIIAVSAAGRAGPLDVDARALELGADHFLRKPFESSELLRIIGTLVPPPPPSP